MSSNNFAEFGVPADLVGTLHARGLESAFDIQAMTLPDGLAGRDLCGRAPTGSGKTIAFGIPLAARVSTSLSCLMTHHANLPASPELILRLCQPQ